MTLNGHNDINVGRNPTKMVAKKPRTKAAGGDIFTGYAIHQPRWR